MAVILRYQLVLSVAVYLLPATRATHYPDNIHGDDPCGAAYTITNDALFSFVKYMQFFSSCHCTTIFSATNGTKLVAKFLIYSIDPSDINEKGNCSTQFIQLYNSSQSPLIGPGAEYCGSAMPTSEYVLGVEGKFSRTIKVSYGIITTTSVQILLTEVLDKEYGCPDGYFDCQNNFCVNNDVTCNGYDDCGNSNDEFDACELSPGAVAGIVIGSVVLFPVLVYLLCVLTITARRQRR